RMPRPRVCRSSRHGVVLVHVPERTVVEGVDGHVRVVAPARVGRRLDTGAVDDRAFAQGHLPEWVAGEPARVADGREHSGPGDDAVAEADVALLVHGDAAHPAMDAVAGRVRPLLVEGVDAVCAPDLVPPYSGDAGAGLHRLVRDQRLVVLEVPVGEPE